MKTFRIICFLIVYFLVVMANVSAQNTVEPKFFGIGITVGFKDNVCYVDSVFKNSPSSGKLQKGDVIKKFGSTEVSRINAEMFMKELCPLSDGEIVVNYNRNGIDKTITIKPGLVEYQKNEIPDCPSGKVRMMEYKNSRTISFEYIGRGQLRKGDAFLMNYEGSTIGAGRIVTLYGNRGEIAFVAPMDNNIRMNPGKLEFLYLCNIPDKYVVSLEEARTRTVRNTDSVSNKNESNSSVKKGEPTIIINHLQYETVDTNHIRTIANVSNTGNGNAENLTVICCFVNQFDKVYASDKYSIGTLPPGGSKKLTFFSLIPGNIQNVGSGISSSMMVKIGSDLVNLKSKFVLQYNGKSEIYK